MPRKECPARVATWWRVAAGPLLHGLQFREQRAEELELVRVAHRAIGLLRLDLGQQHVDRVGLACHLAEAAVPRRQLEVIVGQPVDRLLELDAAPDPELVVVIVGFGALEMVQRRLGLAPVVEHVGEVDARLGVLRLQLERPPDPEERAGIVAEPVRRVAEACRRLGATRRAR